MDSSSEAIKYLNSHGDQNIDQKLRRRIQRAQQQFKNQRHTYQLFPYLSRIKFITKKTSAKNSQMIPAQPNPFYHLLLPPITYDPLSYPFQINFSNERPATDDTTLIKKEEPTENDIIQLLPKDLNLRKEQSSQGSCSKVAFPNVNQQKKHFKKDKSCPVGGCSKKYSSRIAMRAHLRKKHPAWADQTSDYQP